MARMSEWFHRYAVAEVTGLVCALLAAVAVGRTAGPAAAAIAGTLGEGVGFYGVILVREVRRHGATWRVARGLVVEFGLAEVADTLAVRPLAMYGATVLAGDTLVGVLVGKVAADVVFYTVAIAGYELRKRLDTWTALAAGRAAATPAGAMRIDGQPAVRAGSHPAGQVAMTSTVNGRIYGRPAVAVGPGSQPVAEVAMTTYGRIYGQPAVARRIEERPADAGGAYGRRAVAGRPADASAAYSRWAAAGRVDGHPPVTVRIA
jgi:hypothetical protein